MSGYVVNQRWRLLTGSRYEITYILARTHDSNDISMATTTFSRSSNLMEIIPILPAENKSEIQDGHRYTGSACISACRHDRIEISKAPTMFSRMDNSMALRRMLSDVSRNRESKMAAAELEMHVSQFKEMRFPYWFALEDDVMSCCFRFVHGSAVELRVLPQLFSDDLSYRLFECDVYEWSY